MGSRLRSNVFELGVLVFSIVLYIVYRSPPILYFGLPYALVIHLRSVRMRKPGKLSPLGIGLIAISPYFLLHRFGEYPSPVTFQAFVVIGFTLIFLDLKEVIVPILFMALGPFLALIARFSSVSSLVSQVSNVFVDVTSLMVRWLVGFTGYPIYFNGNVITVGNIMIVVGSGCSGLSAFVLYLVVTLLLVYVRRSGFREALYLFLGALGIIPVNALRIFILLVVGYRYGLPYLEVFHSHIGDLMFIAYVYVYWWFVLRHVKKKGKKTSVS